MDPDAKPQLREGFLEKKGHGKVHMGGEWARRYLFTFILFADAEVEIWWH